MIEPTIPSAAATDPREWKQLIHAAAARGPTAIEATTGMIYVLRQREIEQLLHEPRLRGVGLSLFDRMGIADGPLRDWYGALMFTNDGAAHDRLRRLVSNAFKPRAVERLRPVAAARVGERLAAVREAGRGDLVAAFAGLPMHMMCSLLGVPAAAVPDFIAWVDALSPVFLFVEPAQVASATAAIGQLLAYLREIARQRSHTPADDLMTSLLRAEHEGDRLTRAETVTMVANLLVGGHDTTASQIGCTLLTLLSQPNALAALRSDPALLPALVSETVRFEPSIAGAPRTVFEPIEVCGTLRAAGAVLMCSFLTANGDPDVCQDADSFVPRRFASPSAPRLLSFGGGPHYCLGAALARMTLEEVVRGVGELAPTLSVDADTIEWVQSLGRCPLRLPVAVGVTAGAALLTPRWILLDLAPAVDPRGARDRLHAGAPRTSRAARGCGTVLLRRARAAADRVRMPRSALPLRSSAAAAHAPSSRLAIRSCCSCGSACKSNSISEGNR